jgi:hypothetical protein
MKSGTLALAALVMLGNIHAVMAILLSVSIEFEIMTQ